MRRNCLVLVLCLVGATLAFADPAGADVAVTVTPDSDLSSGDVVTVEASGLPPNESIFFCEVIVELAPAQESSGAPAFVGSSDGSGNFANEYSVQRFVAAQLMTQVDCVVVACGIAVANAQDIEATMVIAPISFLPGPVPRPDAILKRRTVEGQLVGDNIYNDTAFGQTLGHAILPGGKWSFALRMQNDGEATDDLRVRFGGGSASGSVPGFSWSVRYFVGYYDVTALVVNGPGFVFQDVPVGETRKMAVQFRVDNDPPASFAGLSVTVRLSSDAAPEVRDAVRVGVRIL